MAECKDPLELVVKFNGDVRFITSEDCDRLLLQQYIAAGIKDAFNMVGTDCNDFSLMILRQEEQTLARQNENGEWVLNDG